MPCLRPTASSTRTPSGTTSFPIPSPGIVAMRYVFILLSGVRRQESERDPRDERDQQQPHDQRDEVRHERTDDVLRLRLADRARREEADAHRRGEQADA